MSEPEKPLHVKVAEVLAWRDAHYHADDWWGHHGAWSQIPYTPIPHFDRDWSVTGPLIVKYRFAVAPVGDRWRAALDIPNGYAVTDYEYLAAVCRLIIALAATGTLEARL